MADHIPLLWDTVLVPPTKRRFGAADTLTFPYNTASGNIFRFENGPATDRLTLNYLGSLISTPAAPTAPFNAHEINLTSGGLDAETMVGLKVNLTGAGAGVDINSAPIYALDLNYTSGGGSNLPYGINIDANWDYGIHSASAIYGAGVELSANTVLIGPENASTNKDIVAYQASASNPTIRYDYATSTWMLTHNGTNYYDILTSAYVPVAPTWDALYAGSQTMAIGTSSPLTWTQTSTAGYGFVVDKTVTGATTAIMKVAANTAGYSSSVPVLEVSRADYGDALKINGDIEVVDRSIRFSSVYELTMQTTGAAQDLLIQTNGVDSDLAIKTLAASAGITLTSAESLVLTSTGGTTISSGNTLDIKATSGLLLLSANTSGVAVTGQTSVGLKVNVAGAGNHMTLEVADNTSQELEFKAHGSAWIPLNSSAAPNLATTAKNIVGAINELNAAVGVSTWDQIYAGSQTLSISGAGVPLTFTQTGNVGSGFVVNRNKDAGNSTLPIMTVDNQNASDDQSALAVSAAVSTTTALSALTSTLTASAAHTSGISVGVESIISPHASDTSGGAYRAFMATGSAVGSGTKDGFYADANWDYGLNSLSPISSPVLFISETTTPTPVASSGALYTKSDNIPYFQDGAGTEHALAFAAEYASMYLNDNSSATVVETANTPIGLRNFTSGTLSGWTFDAGSTGAITVYADYSGTIAGTVLATAAAHGLSTGDYITIRGTTNYNGLYQITDTDGGHFYFTAAWAGDDGASDFDQASYLEAGSTSAGMYSIEWSLTINMGIETWTEITVIPYKNTTSVPEAVAQMGVGGFDKPTCMSATGFVTSVASGDRIFLAPQYTEIYDIYAVFGSLKLTRV